MPFLHRNNKDRTKVTTISTRDLRRKLDRHEDFVVLDARKPGGLAEFPGTIPGALRMAAEDLPDRYSELPKDKLIVPFCT